MPLDPQTETLLDQFEAQGAPPLEEMAVPDARAMMTMLTQLTAASPDGVTSEDLTVPTPHGNVLVRLYRSDTVSRVRPLLVWLHGGGWVIGDVGTADPTARDLALRTGALVASVDYPLAPEHPFPAGLEACYAVTSWLANHAVELDADPARIAVGGDSAGGNLAAATALLARDRGGPSLKFQLLVYPVTDCLLSHPSVKGKR